MAKQRMYDGQYVVLDIDTEEPVWTVTVRGVNATDNCFDIVTLINAIIAELGVAAAIGGALLAEVYRIATEKNGDGEL